MCILIVIEPTATPVPQFSICVHVMATVLVARWPYNLTMQRGYRHALAGFYNHLALQTFAGNCKSVWFIMGLTH